MLIGETVRVALGALRANKLRSLLTMLGIVIGVAAVIAVVALGRGAQKAVNDRIAALGTTLLTVSPGQAFGMGGVTPDVTLVGIEPTPMEIDAAATVAAAADATVLFLYDGNLYPSNRALLDALQGRARHLTVMLLRDPYDAALIKPGTHALTAYVWRKCQLDALIARLLH